MENELWQNNIYHRITGILQAARQNVVRTVNRTMVYAYYEIGRIIVEDEQQGKERAEYGKHSITELSKKLTNEFGKGFSERNIEQMRKFYLTYSIPQKSSAELQLIEKEEINELFEKPVVLNEFDLSWSHYLKLMRIENPDERKFYEIECQANSWSLKEFQRQYDSALFERLALSRDRDGVKKLSEMGQIIENPKDLLKDPYILEFLDLPDQFHFSESDLEQAIINKIEHFLLELGKGFTFVGRQVRFTFDDKHFKVDLVFFNRILRCFVVIDLKIGELTHQDLGQIQMYVNY